MNQDVFQIYHRGFLGKVIANDSPESDTSAILKKLKNIQFNPNVFVKEIKNPIFNQDVEALYSHLSKSSVGTYNFDFHQKILSAFLDAFEAEDFFEWLDVQENSPQTTYLHSKFLIDTLKFLGGEKREMSFSTWESLLNATQQNGEWAPVIEKAMDVKKSLYLPEGASFNRFRDVAVVWCSRQGGINDMLNTLHILFGR